MPNCLIANDEPLQLMILRSLMEQCGFCIKTAQNGYEAFQAVQETLQYPNKMFDLVILDLCMPIMNGQDACKNICRLYSEPQKT
jgi:CheY-like chemotaxis protein